jgi:PAS domain S-box-containing protein
MENDLKILFVEDLESDADLIMREIRKNEIGFKKLLVCKKEDYLDGLESFKPDLIISDYSLPQFDGMTALLLRNQLAPLIPFILVTGSNNETIAVECMKAGAEDYILKDNLSRLGQSVINSLNKAKVLREKNIVEEALIESETKYRQLVSRSPDGIFIVDLSGRFISVNNTICDNLNYSEEELLSMKIWDIVPKKYQPMQKQRLSIILNGENKIEGAEYEIIGKNGKIHPVEILSVAYYESGKIVGIQGIARDILERKQNEKNLKEKEEKYRRIFENVQDLYYESAMDGTILEVSPSISNLSHGQYKREDLIGRSMSEFYSFPGEREMLMEALMTKGSISDFEIKLRSRDGSMIQCSVSSKIFFDTEGKPQKIIGSMRDISKRKKTEVELKQSYGFSESLLKTIPFGMDIVDESGTVLFQSENFKKLFVTDVIGRKCWELYRDDLMQCSDCPLLKGITVGETEAYESSGVLGNRIFEISHTGMIYKDKKAMLEIFQDITERKNNETALIAAKEKAEESDRLKTAFLHNISHEIRTPMNAIFGFSSLLSEPELDPDSQKSYIETIMQSSNHLLEIITDIVDISNIEANLVRISRDAIDINSLLKSICIQFQPVASAKDLDLSCEYGLSESESFITADRTKLTQVISNLINNALKFTQQGSVAISLKKVNDFLYFSVSDTGIGIPTEAREKIFDMFYQVENSLSRSYEGTGLGLAISKAYVELAGGKIWFTSVLGKGTIFNFTIPYEKQGGAITSEVVEPAEESFSFKRKFKILVAEDDESNFNLIRYYLSETNIEIVRASNGKEAIEKIFSEKNIDLIFMDIKMPVMDGYTALKLLREANVEIPVIVITAYADDTEKANSSGCNGFLSKPFTRENLLKVLSDFI